MNVNNQFVMSTENECLTVGGKSPNREGELTGAMRDFLNALARTSPSLPDLESGIFTCYGRVYVDTGSHVELAAIESDSPYLLPLFLEQQHELARQANESLIAGGKEPLILANNNHSGLLVGPATPIWGAHENYMVERPTREFRRALIPFLATRVYAGAGVVEYPTGRYLASVRASRVVLDEGGDTTSHRAIFSPERESHVDAAEERWRVHLICGDGHRCWFNVALQFGCTALALKAVMFNPRLCLRLPTIPAGSTTRGWAKVMRGYNLLAQAGQPPLVDPRVIEIQRVYLDGALDYAASTSGLPDWVEPLLIDWDETLRRMAESDIDWLSERLDAWTKYRLFSNILDECGRSWRDVPNDKELCSLLTLVNQKYHEFTDRDGPFVRMERAGLLNHRTTDYVAPGAEPEPFVPDTRTRAAARARFIRDHAGDGTCAAGWSMLRHDKRYLSIGDPFATRPTRHVRMASRMSSLSNLSEF